MAKSSAFYMVPLLVYAFGELRCDAPFQISGTRGGFMFEITAVSDNPNRWAKMSENNAKVIKIMYVKK